MAIYRPGSVIKCQVTGVEKYGAFVSIDSEFVGLIHISEVSNNFVRDIKDFINIGDEIYCQIIDVDLEHKKLSLSIKNINYKTNSKSKICESRLGFLPLKNNLNRWIEERMAQINSNK